MKSFSLPREDAQDVEFDWRLRIKKERWLTQVPCLCECGIVFIVTFIVIQVRSGSRLVRRPLRRSSTMTAVDSLSP